MTISIHDNVVYGYTVSMAELTKLYTIRLYTAWYHGNPTEYTDVVFHHVIAHHFHEESVDSVLCDIQEESLEAVYADYTDLFERFEKYSWPLRYTTKDDLMSQLTAQLIKAFRIYPTCGTDGWIWAQSMAMIPRSEQKIFED